MTREEIERSFQYNMTDAFIKGWYEKNHERYTEEIEDVFYQGAYSAQKYLIEKACKWIDDVHISKYLSCIFSGAANISFISDDFIRDFKKAMEE